MSSTVSYSDEQLIASIRDGSSDAYAELFNRHWDNVYRMIYARTGKHDVTEELAQEIFIKLWDKRSDLIVENFSAYLYTCVKNRCLNYIESMLTQRKQREHYRHLLPKVDDSVNGIIALNDLSEALEKGLTTIPEKSETIFRLNKLEGKSIKEIARKMNLTEKAIQYHITRSTKELRLYLKDFFL